LDEAVDPPVKKFPGAILITQIVEAFLAPLQGFSIRVLDSEIITMKLIGEFQAALGDNRIWPGWNLDDYLSLSHFVKH